MPIYCFECNKLYSTQFNLNKHMRTVHNKEPKYIEYASETKYMCVTCNVYFQFNNDLRKHLVDKHNVENIVEEMRFESLSAFTQWLSEEESSKKVQYVRNAGKKRSLYGFEKIYYECRRSYRKENLVQNINRKRSLQSQGSCKMEKSCISQIIIKRNTTTDECFVTYYKSHYLHDSTDIQHLQIPKKDKEVIASKLIMGVPAKGILNSTRESISADLKRIDILTNKDIRNIKMAYKINFQDGCHHSDDATSVDIWVKECEKSDCNPILFYKPQGQKLDNFEDNDFCLIIMNSVQKKILTDFGQKIITIDGTHGLNAYNFELTTLLTLDENREGFPVAFMFSNRKDTSIYIIFFTQIKKVVGQIHTDIFMSDITETYINAWNFIMGPVKKRLLCSWHVDRAWQSNVMKIANTEKRSWVYKSLKFLQYLLSISDFQKKNNDFLSTILEDEETKDFAIYIQKYYLPITEQWAYCYRSNCGVNTNMHIESFHKAIKYNYLDGKKIKRLDKSIHQLMLFVRDKIVNRIIYLKKGKNLKNTIISRHRYAMTLKFNLTQEEPNCWSLENIQTNECQSVKRLSFKVCCSVKCAFCNICIHTFSCSCTDFVIKTTICKHIHYVMLNTDNNMSNNTNEINLSQNDDHISQLTELINPDNKKDHCHTKDKIRSNFAHILNNLDNLREDQLKLILQHSNTCVVVSNLSQNEDKFEITDKSKNEPVNKNITKQKSFFSTKKKNNIRKNAMSKASKEESKIVSMFINKDPVISNDPANDHKYV